MSQFSYRADIDGLRAVSVTAVLLFHGRLACPGGFVGVDVFFVISGFLITSLILRDLNAGNFSLTDFWARRVRRILPALTVCMLGTLALGCLLMLPNDLETLAESGIAQSLCLANVHFSRTLDYFAGRGERFPLLHTWSLAVEEQYYFVFPVFMAWVGKTRRALIVPLLSLLAILSLVLSIAGTYYAPQPTFYLLPTRAWELLAGSLTACLAPSIRPGRRVAECLSFMGLAAILFSIFSFDQATRFPGAAALVPCLGAVAVIWPNGEQPTLVQRLLALRPLVFVGLISYSLYLWHWPLLAFMNYCLYNGATFWIRVGVVALGVIAGVVSWRFVETPFRRSTPGQRSSNVVWAGLAASVATLTLWGTAAFTEGFHQRISQELQDYVSTATLEGAKKYNARGFPLTDPDKLPTLGVSEQPPCFLVWGDSHARGLGRLLDLIANEQHVSGRIAVANATVPLLGCARRSDTEGANRFNQAVMEYVRRHQIRHVILVSAWTHYQSVGPEGRTEALAFDSKSTSNSPSEARDAFARGVNSTLAALREANVDVWVVRQVPAQQFNVVWSVAKSRITGGATPKGVAREQYRARAAGVDECFRTAGLESDKYIDCEADFFGDNENCQVCDDGGVYYFDSSHLSHYGSERLMKSRLSSVIARIAADCSPNQQ
jgi:peptidoglycan/LPS O-acetylase OafA/YrhL